MNNRFSKLLLSSSFMFSNKNFSIVAQNFSVLEGPKL